MHSIQESRNYCSACPKMCHFSCPVAQVEKNESYSPAMKQQTAKLIAEKKLPLNPDHALSAYKCLGCRASEEYCDHDIVVADSLQQIREQAVKAHAAPPEIYLFEKKFRKFSNPYGVDLSKRIRQVPAKWLDPSKPDVFFLTCHQLGSNPKGLQEYLSLFSKLNINDLKLCSENIQCCGYSLWTLGFQEEFEELANIQFNQLQGAECVIVGSPECAWAMREIYPKMGLKGSGKVMSLFEYVADRLGNTAYRSKSESSQKYIYHDSCYMGRYLGFYEEPRQLLEMLTGQEVEEFACHRKDSICSGAGGGYSLHSSEAAQEIARGRIQEMQAKGIKTLVTACPQSAEHFRSLKEKIIVKDLVSFLGECIVELAK